MNTLRSQSVRAEERSIHSSHTNRESREKHAKDIMRALRIRSEKGNAPMRKAQ